MLFLFPLSSLNTPGTKDSVQFKLLPRTEKAVYSTSSTKCYFNHSYLIGICFISSFSLIVSSLTVRVTERQTNMQTRQFVKKQYLSSGRSQLSPVNPIGHKHIAEPFELTHVPPFPQYCAYSSHSSTSSSQNVP